MSMKSSKDKGGFNRWICNPHSTSERCRRVQNRNRIREDLSMRQSGMSFIRSNDLIRNIYNAGCFKFGELSLARREKRPIWFIGSPSSNTKDSGRQEIGNPIRGMSTFKCRMQLANERVRSCEGNASDNMHEYESDGVDADEYHTWTRACKRMELQDVSLAYR
jgi:hypothetical protein